MWQALLDNLGIEGIFIGAGLIGGSAAWIWYQIQSIQRQIRDHEVSCKEQYKTLYTMIHAVTNDTQEIKGYLRAMAQKEDKR